MALNTGIGNYDIYIRNYDTLKPPSEHIVKMKFGKLYLPSSSSLWGGKPFGFVYWWGKLDTNWEKEAKDRLSKLEALPDYLNVSAYVTFKNVLSMQELIDLMNKYPPLYFYWSGIAARGEKDKEGKATALLPLIGFDLRHYSGGRNGTIEEKYPYIYMDSDFYNSADIYESYFRSLLHLPTRPHSFSE